MRFCVLTSDSIVCVKTLLYASLPVEDGTIEVLPGHAPLLQKVVEGVVMLKEEDATSAQLSIGPGLCLISPSEMILFTLSALFVSLPKTLEQALKDVHF